jgi:O-antigen/teichoic acid export membrane protein
MLKGALRRRGEGEGRTGSAAVTVGGSLVGALGAFAAAIVAARTLDTDQFAAFGVGLAVHSLCTQLSDFGLGTVAVTELATGASAGGGGTVAGRIRPLASRRLVSAIAIGTVITLVALAIPALSPYRLAILVGAGGAVLWSMDQFLVQALQGLYRFNQAASVLAAIGILRLAFVLACSLTGVHGLALLIAYAVVAPAVAAPIAGLVLLAQRRGLRGTAAERTSPDQGIAPGRAAVTPEFRRSVATMYLGGAALFNFDVLLLALISSQADVATYSAAWRVAAGVSLVNTAITQAVLPYTVAVRDPWREARLLSRAGLVLTAAWLALVPVLTLAGLAVLGSAGNDAAAPMAVLLVAFSLDGFCDLTVQIYYRVNRASVAAINRVSEFATMAAVTVALQATGALAPSLGQLGARLVGVAIIGGPIVLARVGQLRWFETGAPEPAAGEALGVDIRGAEERLGL